MWPPFAEHRPDHRAGIELTAIDPHRAAEAAADIKGRLDDRVARKVWRDRLKIRDFPGWAAAGHSGSSSSGQRRYSTMANGRAPPCGRRPFVELAVLWGAWWLWWRLPKRQADH